MRRLYRYATVLFVTILIANSTNAAIPFSYYKHNYLLGKDSTSISFRSDNLLNRAMPSAAMIGSGLILSSGSLKEKMIHYDNDFNSKNTVADIMRFSPAALMIGLKVCGVEGRSDWNRLIAVDGFASLMTCALVGVLKYSVKEERPDGSDNHSFPSGHAAISFMTATMLHKEYGETVSPWFSIIGYGTASVVSLSRVYDNNHWCSDVLVGAGIGIFSTEFSYDLSDALFGEKHLSRATLRPQQNDYKWSFGLNSDYHFSTDIHDDLTKLLVKPAYSMNINANRMLCNWLGAEISTGFTQLQMTQSSNSLYQRDDIINIKNVSLGCLLDIPVIKHLNLSGKFNIGKSFGLTEKFGEGNNSISLIIPDALRINCNFGLSLNTTVNSKISAYIGIDSYSDVWLSYFAGTGFNFIF
jgi:membrane-associated phospholipid phosphatase